MDLVRTQLQSQIDNAKTPEEAELAAGLLYGYDLGELKVLTDVATGKLLFALAPPN